MDMVHSDIKMIAGQRMLMMTSSMPSMPTVLRGTSQANWSMSTMAGETGIELGQTDD